MKGLFKGGLVTWAALPAVLSTCISSGDQNTINNALKSGGAGAVVQLCQNAFISITDQISFTADGQEISTEKYPTGSSRATIQVAVGSGASTMIYAKNLNGLRIRNIQLDGNRPNAGFVYNGGANIEIGGIATDLLVEYVATSHPRGWSCLHVISTGTTTQPCTNATIVHNDIGPCGEAGRDSNGHGVWADGISFECENGLVQGNTIIGPTDGGIVVFGSPGTLINNNTIISSDEHLAFGAINMVDPQYGGSYAGVTVSNNIIIGKLMFNLGIGMGAYAWSSTITPYLLKGPATITGNTFSGNIAFPIAVNGWTDGLTVTNNVVSGVTTPKSSFSDDGNCNSYIKAVWNDNANLVYYPAGLTGPQTLQSDFVQTTGNATNFLCVTLPLPNSVTYGPGDLTVVANGSPINLHGGVRLQYQGDQNLVVIENGSPVWASGVTLTQGCGSPPQCTLAFESDGNLISYYQGQAQWNTRTSGTGQTLRLQNMKPWIEILDASGSVVWNAATGVYRNID